MSANRGHVAMLAFSAFVAGSFSLGALAAPYIDPLALNAPRMIAASVVLFIVARMRGQVRREYFASPWRYALMGSGMALYFATMFWALQRTSAVSTTAVFTMTPILSALFGWVLLRQRTTPAMLGAMFLAAFGALWVIFRADWGAFSRFDIGIGEKVFFLGCAGHALYAALVKKLNRGEPLGFFTFGVVASCALWLTILGVPAMIATDWANLPAIVWITMGYTFLFASATTFFLVQFAAMRLGAGQVMAYTYLTPGFVLIWNIAIGQGIAQPVVWIGALIACSAMVVLFYAGGGCQRGRSPPKNSVSSD